MQYQVIQGKKMRWYIHNIDDNEENEFVFAR